MAHLGSFDSGSPTRRVYEFIRLFGPVTTKQIQDGTQCCNPATWISQVNAHLRKLFIAERIKRNYVGRTEDGRQVHEYTVEKLA